MSGPAILVRGLCKSFSGRRAVDRLDLSILPNEIFGLVGPDGAGKTTAMRMLAGVMRPDAGEIRIDDIDILADPDRAKHHVSYMPQRFGLYEDLTVDENIRFYADLFSIPRAQRLERAERLLSASDMGQFRGRLAGQLSGGMKQKLGLTCALIHAPRIVLLDEPTTGVDPVSRRDFWRVLYELRETGLTILISTAYLDEAERCHRLALLHQGRLLDCDTPQAMRGRMRRQILAVVSRQARALRAAATAAEGVIDVLLVGDALHVIVDDAGRRRAGLIDKLTATGIAFQPPVSIEPSIEDLFVTLEQPVRA
jgi:ABC-2 type transport system ATP-binding protein